MRSYFARRRYFDFPRTVLRRSGANLRYLSGLGILSKASQALRVLPARRHPRPANTNRALRLSTPTSALAGREATFLRLLEPIASVYSRSEEHTSELQSLRHLVCRLRLEKK